MLTRMIKFNDINSLEELEKRAFIVGPYSKEMLQYALSEAGDLAYLIEDSGKIAAYIMASPIHADTIDIESVAVDPDYRGKGLATLLMNKVENVSRVRNFKKIILEVREHNKEAIGLYTKLGFSRSEFLKDYYEEYHEGSRSAYRMEKLLL
jgi:ribosomal-protein-alanine N-acetyltransferase